jgi:DNA repair photolyase
MRSTLVTSVLNVKKRRDPWFLDEYTFNPFSSCGFNCLYCYIRGSKYGTKLQNSLSVKENALALLDKQLAARAKKNAYGFVVMSSATDPYLKQEAALEISRGALQLFLKHRFPVHIITKGNLVSRDFDLIKAIAETAILPSDLQGKLPGALLTFSFSTLGEDVGKIFEPGAPSPKLRLEILAQAVQEGIYTGVSLMPLLPWISDTTESLDAFFSSFQKAKAKYVMPASIGLYGMDKADSKTLFLKAIEKHFPELLSRYQQYFTKSNEMPAYYRDAFLKKMKALEIQYGMPSRISST